VIVSTIINLGKAFGLGASAESIETAEPLARLREMGCELGQGYYFSRPVPSTEIRPATDTTS
jgi:EAL domain-containing protein (putative c-di-GMP-specific phosphodiesterase class I)